PRNPWRALPAIRSQVEATGCIRVAVDDDDAACSAGDSRAAIECRHVPTRRFAARPRGRLSAALRPDAAVPDSARDRAPGPGAGWRAALHRARSLACLRVVVAGPARQTRGRDRHAGRAGLDAEP